MIKKIILCLLLMVFFSAGYSHASFLSEENKQSPFGIIKDSIQSGQYFQQGKIKYQAKEYITAINYFTKAIEADHRYAEAYKYRGRCYYKINDYKKSKEDLNKAILIAPFNIETFLFRGQTSEKLNEYTEAIKDYSKIIEIDSTRGKAYYSRAEVKVVTGDYKGALLDYNKAIQYDPKFVDNYIDRGICKRHLKDYKGSIEDYNQALYMDSRNGRTYFNRGISEISLFHYQEAVKDFSFYIELEPKDASGYYRRGMCNKELLDYENAVKDFNQSINLKETYDAFFERGNVKTILADYKGALEDYKSCARIAPDRRDALYYFNLGSLHARFQNYPEALQAYSTSLQVAENSLTYNSRGNVKLNQKDHKGAEADFKKSNDIYPSVSAYDGLVLIYMEKKDYPKALGYVNKAIGLDSINAKLYNDRAIIKLNLGDPAGAIDDYNQAIEWILQVCRLFLESLLLRKET